MGRRSEIFGKRISDRNGDVQQSTMARERARIEWQKEGGRHVGGMLKSRGDRSREQKAEMIDASEAACLSRYPPPPPTFLLLFFHATLLPNFLKPDDVN